MASRGVGLVDRLQPGDPSQIGPFRLLGRLGEGGMGRVYLGQSPGGRKVAIKVVHPHYACDPEFRRRFAREVAAARQVGGFHTAAVVGADPEADPPWMATAYIPGPSLAEAIAQHGPLDQAEVRELGAALAEGLAAIHECGLIHRDLKPGNVIMAEDGPRIIDFGIVKGADATALTGSSAVIGTLRYMSPEQLHGLELTPHSDVFALGTVLAYAATGHDPFEAPTIPAVITRILTGPPDLDPLTGDLRGIIGDCLAKDPGSRPTPGDILARLSRPVPRDPTVIAAPAPVPAAGSAAAGQPVTQAAWSAGADFAHGTVTVTSARAGGPPASPARSAGDEPASSEVPGAGKPTARPAPPKSIVHAVRAMYAGAALSVISAAAALLSLAVLGRILLLLGVLIATGLWLRMAWANKGGRSWARLMATVFFGLLTVGELALLIKSLTGEIFLTVGYFLLVSLCLVYWLAGLSTVVLVWQRSSSDYYTAVGNRSKATREVSRKPHDQPAARHVKDPDQD